MNSSSSETNGPTGQRPEDWEGWLARHRFRSPPAAWREAILANAFAPVSMDAEASTESGGTARPIDRRNGTAHPRPVPVSASAAAIRRFLDRFASGWTVVAAAWALVFALNQYSLPRLDRPRVNRPPWSERALAEIRAQERLMAEVSGFGGWESGPASRPDPRLRNREAIRPRAERETRKPWMIV